MATDNSHRKVVPEKTKTNLQSLQRGSSSSTKVLYFPEALSPQRRLKISVYDTTEGDPNIEIAAGSKGFVETSIKATKKIFTSISDGEFLDAAETVVKKAGAALLNTIEAGVKSIGVISTTTGTFGSRLNDAGNVALVDKFIQNIFLPFPNEVQESINQSWGEQESIMRWLPTGLSGGTAAVEAISNKASLATGTQALKANLNKSVKWEETEFRSISLTWTLVPNNANESKTIHEIITSLKAFASPQAVVQKSLLRAPFYFKLMFGEKDGVINQALQFTECVITSIEVNYSVTGNMETFNDNNPKTMQLSITFKDREPKTLSDWSKPIAAQYDAKTDAANNQAYNLIFGEAKTEANTEN